MAGSRHRIGRAARLELSAYLAQADYEVPGPLTLAAALGQPRLAPAAVQRDRPRRNSDLARLAAQLKSAGSAGHFAAEVAWLRLRDDFHQLQGNGETDAISDDVTAHATASRHLGQGAGGHHLLARAVSHGVEPPSFDDLIAVQGAYPALSLRSRELRAQRATTLELGVQGECGPLDWNVAVYRGRWRDEILRLADANGLPRGAVNAGATRHEGIETSLRWRLIDGPRRLTLAASSTLGRFVFTGDPVYGRHRIAGAPPQVGAAELAYGPSRGGYAAIEST